MNQSVFTVDKGLNDRMKQKWANIHLDVVAFDFGPNNLKIDSRIKDFWQIDENELIDRFKALCLAFTKICYENEVSCNQLDTIVGVDVNQHVIMTHL